MDRSSLKLPTGSTSSLPFDQTIKSMEEGFQATITKPDTIAYNNIKMLTTHPHLHPNPITTPNAHHPTPTMHAPLYYQPACRPLPLPHQYHHQNPNPNDQRPPSTQKAQLKILSLKQIKQAELREKLDRSLSKSQHNKKLQVSLLDSRGEGLHVELGGNQEMQEARRQMRALQYLAMRGRQLA